MALVHHLHCLAPLEHLGSLAAAAVAFAVAVAVAGPPFATGLAPVWTAAAAVAVVGPPLTTGLAPVWTAAAAAVAAEAHPGV